MTDPTGTPDTQPPLHVVAAQTGPAGTAENRPGDSDAATARLLAAIKPHVPFDGWSERAFRAAIVDSGVEPAVARGVCPRGAVDLAAAFHREGDVAMLRRLQEAELGHMRLREKVAAAVRFRLEAVEDRELVRRASSLFALPPYAAEGARLVWGTADAIWTALGDRSDDVNWYTKRATLSGVYSATVLYWLGDDSEGAARSWAFLDRRVDDVMRFEKLKAQVNDNPVLRPLLYLPNRALGMIRAPSAASRSDLPGSLSGSN